MQSEENEKTIEEGNINSSTYQILEGEKKNLLFDGQNYYLIRSLNKFDVDSLDNGDGTISPRGEVKEECTINDILNQVQMFRRKTGLISMSEDPNVVLTYDRSNLHRFALIRIPKGEIQNHKKIFPVGDYLLNIMDNQIDSISKKAPENVKRILSNVDKATSIKEIIQTINGAERQVEANLIETKQQYLSEEEQLEQSKKIAKCKVLCYYGLMKDIIPGKSLSEYTADMRMGYSSSEWLHTGKIDSENVVQIPKILVEALALLKQAEFNGKDVKTIEQGILKLANSGVELSQGEYQKEYSLHKDIKQDLSIDKAFSLANGEISYRDTNIQMMAIRSLAEMTLNKRAILELLHQEFPEIEAQELLKDTYCINSELTTRINNKGNQIGKNVNLLISDYGYTLDNEISSHLLEKIESLSLEQLNDIVINGVNSQEASKLLVTTRKDEERIQSSFRTKTLDSKYMAEAIIEGYNWREDGNSLTTNEKERLANRLLLNVTDKNELHTLYEAISKTQIGRNKFTQNDIFAIIINLAIDRKIGDITWKELLEKDRWGIQQVSLDNKEKLQTSVLPISIDLLAGRGKEINRLKQELIDLGIDRNFIEAKDISNVYVAKQIVEGYDFGRNINQEEKRALIISILDNSILNNNKCMYLTTLMQNMGQIGLNKQDIYRMIINLGVNGRILEETGYAYSDLLTNSNNACQTIVQYKDKICTQVTESTINKAVSNNLTAEMKESLKQELIDLGIDKDFIEKRDIKNVYIAKQIVEGYDFGRKINQEEKRAILVSILNNSFLKAKRNGYLTTLMQNMEQIGLNKREIYGMIINLGVNGKALKEAGYDYNRLLANSNNACQTIAKYKDKIQTTVTESTIDKAVSNNLTAEIQEILKQGLVDLGIDRNFIEAKDISNVYIVKQIVEGYDFGRKINQEEKRAILVSILNNNCLNTKKSIYLTTLIQNMEQIGLNKREIYGMIINLGVNGRLLEEKGCNYSELLENKNNACQTIVQYKDKIYTHVTEGTIDKAVSNNLATEMQESLKQELIDLGLDKDFIEKKDIKNIYVAKQIIEGYDFGRKINQEEKRAILVTILNNSLLNAKNTLYLTTLIQNMEQIGLNKREIYGMIINLGVNGRVLEGAGYAYNELLRNKNNACQTIVQYKDEIRTQVTEETIQKAVKKANKPRKVKGQDIAKSTMDLLVEGSGGSKICDDVQADYQKLLTEKINEKEGSEQDVPN